jgi:hypothetical protein
MMCSLLCSSTPIIKTDFKKQLEVSNSAMQAKELRRKNADLTLRFRSFGVG